MHVQCSGGSRNFAKEIRALKIKSVVTGQLKLTTTNWTITKTDALTTTLEIAVELNVKHSTVVWHLKQIGKVKKLNKWVPLEQTEKPKQNVVVKCPLLLFYATTANHFLIGLWLVMKSGFYMKTIDDQLSHWTKKKLQSASQGQICIKKGGRVMLTGGVLLVWSTTAFWILGKPLHLRSMLSKSVRCRKNCMPTASIGK